MSVIPKTLCKASSAAFCRFLQISGKPVVFELKSTWICRVMTFCSRRIRTFCTRMAEKSASKEQISPSIAAAETIITPNSPGTLIERTALRVISRWNTVYSRTRQTAERNPVRNKWFRIRTATGFSMEKNVLKTASVRGDYTLFSGSASTATVSGSSTSITTTSSLSIVIPVRFVTSSKTFRWTSRAMSGRNAP